MRPSPSSWLLFSLLLGSAAAGEENLLAGGTRLYGGTTVERRVLLPPDAETLSISWRLVALRAEVARGEQVVTRATPLLSLPVPRVERLVPGRLVLSSAGGPVRTLTVWLHPDPSARLATAFGAEPIGWVGPTRPLRVGPGEVALRVVPLGDPGAVRRFRGGRIVVGPGVDDLTPFVPALLERATAGATVLALGVDRAPWLEDTSAEPPASHGPLLEGLSSGDLASWGRGGSAWKRPLRAVDGNHAEWVGGYVRVLYPGAGRMVCASLRLLDDLADEPLAAELLVRLLTRSASVIPVLEGPRSVGAGAGGEVPARLQALLGDATGAGPEVVVLASAPASPTPPKDGSTLVVLWRDGSLRLSKEESLAGPGLAALEGPERPALLRFLTAAGLRVRTASFWKD